MFGGLELKSPGSNNVSSPTETTAPVPAPAPDNAEQIPIDNNVEADKDQTSEVKNESSNGAGGGLLDNIGSAFSFLQSDITSAPPPTLPGMPASSSTEPPAEDNNVSVEDIPVSEKKPETTSAFGFMSNTVTTSDISNEKEDTVVESVKETSQSPVLSSGFSFLSNGTSNSVSQSENDNHSSGDTGIQETENNNPVSDEPKSLPTKPTTGFSFISESNINTSTSNTSIVSSVTTGSTAALVFQEHKPNSDPTTKTSNNEPSEYKDLLAMAPQTNSLPPAGSGLVFTGATGPKKQIKKRSRGKRIGVGVGAAPGAALPGTNNSIPITTPHPHVVPPVPTTPIRPTSSTTSAGGVQINSSTGRNTVISPSPSAKYDAEEANKKAERFIAEKLAESKSLSFNPPPSVPVQKTEPVSPTMAQAQAAAEEAKTIAAKKDSKRGTGIMGGIFNMNKGRSFSFLRENSNHGNSTSKSNSIPELTLEGPPSVLRQTASTDSYQNKMTTDSNTATQSSVYVEENNIETASQNNAIRLAEKHQEERERALQEERRKAEVEKQMLREAEEEEIRRLAEEKLRREKEALELEAKKPENIFKNILIDFEQTTMNAMKRVTQLRTQRASLLEERVQAEKLESLASYQIQIAEKQQMEAAEQEDFETADRISELLDQHDSDKKEQGIILKNIRNALEQLDSQTKNVIAGVSVCFKDVQNKLQAFREEQEMAEKEDSTEALDKFAATSKRLSAESERLNNELKHIERDENMVEEERKELENAISEQCKDVQDLRDEAREKLDQVNEDIEFLRKQLAAKEKLAVDLETQLNGHEECIAKVRTKFSRQLTRVAKKETSVQENRKEFESEKASLQKTKDEHEAELKAHSDMLISYENMMSSIDEEAKIANQLEEFLSKEISLDSSTNSASVDKNDLEALQVDVVRCEAAVSEKKQILTAAVQAMDSLKEEMDTISVRIPILETEKKLAASKRDFKRAGKASKEIKELKARIEVCEQELLGESVDRINIAKQELEKTLDEFSDAEALAHEKEKEDGIQNMINIASKIRRLRDRLDELSRTPDKFKSFDVNVAEVSTAILESEIELLMSEGVNLGDKIGGWEEIFKSELNHENVPEPNEETKDSAEEDDDCIEETEEKENENHSSEVDVDEEIQHETEVEPDVGNSTENISENLLRYRELYQQMKEMEESIENAVEIEDYDKAAELDELMESLKSEIMSLGLSDEEIEKAMSDSVDLNNSGIHEL